MGQQHEGACYFIGIEEREAIFVATYPLPGHKQGGSKCSSKTDSRCDQQRSVVFRWPLAEATKAIAKNKHVPHFNSFRFFNDKIKVKSGRLYYERYFPLF